MWLRTPTTLCIHMPVNIKDILRYITCPDHLVVQPETDAPLPLTADGYDLWEIQTLLAMCSDKKTKRKQDLVLCQGFGVESASWDPVTNLPKAVLNEFYVSQQQAAVLFAEQDDDSDVF